MNEKGLVFNVQKFSIHDGPGIRTTVFLKGCPLKCKWCSNPESQLEKLQVLCDKSKCIKCQSCINNCPVGAISIINDVININYDKCIGCLQCYNNCPNSALSVEGEYRSVDEIVELCLQDKDFYEESNGGVTISGGEGMSQPEFLIALVNKLKEVNIHVAIETTGYLPNKLFQKLAPMFDLLLFDVKHYDSAKHKIGTGVNNELIIENLKWAIENNIPILPRIPIIPDFNYSLDDANGLAKLLVTVGASRVQLLPFHQFGEKKYLLLNKEYEFKNKKALYPEDLIEYQNIFIEEKLDCFI